MRVFEQVAALAAEPHFESVIRQYEIGGIISEDAQKEIQSILVALRSGSLRSNKLEETRRILQCTRTGALKTVKSYRVDLFLKSRDGTEHYFDLKTAKPNIEAIAGFKQKLLEWIAIRGYKEPKIKAANIHTRLAIPYNPYEPKPYERWTFQGMFDLQEEIMVGKEFWDFLGGRNTYNELLGVFEDVGRTLRLEIDAKFSGLSA